MFGGALLFRHLERDNELAERQQYIQLYHHFKWKYCAEYPDATRYINCTLLVRIV